MPLKVFKNTVLLLVLVVISCAGKVENDKAEARSVKIEYNDKEAILTTLSVTEKENDSPVIVGANQIEHYLPILKRKRVGIVANQTSVIFKDNIMNAEASSYDSSFIHLVDSLLKLRINIKKVFAPEHGFRGKADAGEVVKNDIDTKTGLPIVSLYGKHKKPSIEYLQNLDIVIFDIQDVGVRFYTYISSLHYVMEACAEQDISLIVLDRPNPNGHYIDGPILELAHKSFVGMHSVPVVYGMTIGEYAQMINGEAWLKKGVQCNLKIIPIKNYTHQTWYSLPIKPSPNLPNNKAINLYPSLCFFEGTNVSVGRGTDNQFQVIGSPFVNPKDFDFKFTPQSNEGAKYPKHQNHICYGYKISSDAKLNHLVIDWLIEFYNANKEYLPKKKFFNNFFSKLAGTEKLQEQIEANMPIDHIKESWKIGLENFKKIRKKYLIYD